MDDGSSSCDDGDDEEMSTAASWVAVQSTTKLDALREMGPLEEATVRLRDRAAEVVAVPARDTYASRETEVRVSKEDDESWVVSLAETCSSALAAAHSSLELSSATDEVLILAKWMGPAMFAPSLRTSARWENEEALLEAMRSSTSESATISLCTR